MAKTTRSVTNPACQFAGFSIESNKQTGVARVLSR
jgi:hypothetical protein